MNATHLVMSGIVKPDGTLELEGKTNLPPGRVRVTMNVVPEQPNQVETGWALLQADPPALAGKKKQRGKLANGGNVGNGHHAVVRHIRSDFIQSQGSQTLGDQRSRSFFAIG